jgi:hypothetical protein
MRQAVLAPAGKPIDAAHNLKATYTVAATDSRHVTTRHVTARLLPFHCAVCMV